MKQFLRRWLYLTQLSSDFYEAELKQAGRDLKQDELIKELRSRVDELEREARIGYGIMNGLLEHLEVDYYKTLEPDLMFAPPEPRMREVIKLRPKKRKQNG